MCLMGILRNVRASCFRGDGAWRVTDSTGVISVIRESARNRVTRKEQVYTAAAPQLAVGVADH